MNIAVIVFPGSNAETETMHAIERVGMKAQSFLWNASLKKIAKCDGFVIPGGASYGDMGRAGVIAAFSPVMGLIQEKINEGKPVLGIGNGAQILLESGLLPGVALSYNQRIAYDKVVGTSFYNAWVFMRTCTTVCPNAFTLGISPNTLFRVPVVHAQGRFCLSADALQALHEAGMVVFRYCDEAGEVSPHFPVNPNGSADNIAAVSNYAGNVLAIMPHIERVAQGEAIFASIRDFIIEKESTRTGVWSYPAPVREVTTYQPTRHRLIIDKHYPSHYFWPMEVILRERLGIEATIRRYTHWACDCSVKTMEGIMTSQALVDPDETVVELNQSEDTLAFLVTDRDDSIGQQKFQMLANHFEVDGIKSIQRGSLWQITAPGIRPMREAIIALGLFFNSVSQVCVEMFDDA